VNINQNDFHPMQNLISFIRKLSSLFWEVSFNHILREGNEYVDYLREGNKKQRLSLVLPMLIP